jgi:diamine N-acetyltransferase
MPVTIRMAGPQDAVLIADMSRRTFFDTFAEYNTPEDMDHFMNEVFTREELKKEVYDPANIFIIAFEEDQPLGYVRMREGEAQDVFAGEPTLEIARIYNEKAAIGRGVGSALMKACVDLAIARGKKWLWLGVWEKNDRAIAFYSKLGFEKYDTHDFVLGKDVQTDWLMKKQLLS